MQIYLARNNQQAGPYTLEQINQMLVSQQVLLTDLAWHEGLTEWKPLGELTQGKLIYQPEGYIGTSIESPSSQTLPQKAGLTPPHKDNLASIPSRAFAKLIDMLLWIPVAIIPSLFFNDQQINRLMELQKQMQSASVNSSQATALQQELFSLIPLQAWQAMAVYVVIMLIIQAFFLAKSGQSIGKKLAKIKIVDNETGSAVNLTRVFLLRSMVFIILNFLFMPFITVIDYAFAFSKKRQTLHDKLAKTKVINQ